MIEVKTYIKKKQKITSLEFINEEYSKYFVGCEEENCMEYVADRAYIEGVITICCDGVYLLDFRHWDLVDQLWSYFIKTLNELQNGKRQVSFYFPDQPIEVQMKEISKELLLLEIDGRRATVSKQEFMEKMYMEAEQFLKVSGGEESK